jgi:hypothetical protein
MEILEILKYILPSLVVLACSYLMIKQFHQRDAEKARMELLINNNKTVLPVKLAAYERLVLFLERIEPQSIVVRTAENGMTAIELQRDLLTTIRAEFEHNYSQQLYVSNSAWKAVTDTKDVMVQLINQTAQSVAVDAKALDLGKKIIDNYATLQNSPIDMAISVLKTELATIC